jgi:hypothetical protein
MRKFALGLIFAAVCTRAQPLQDLLLPQVQHIVGVIVDSDGTPVVGAAIDHSGDRLDAHQTDSSGRFEFNTRAPLLIIRKTGFRSELVHTQDATNIRVTLQKSTENRAFPTCSNTGLYDGIEGWEASFQFPRKPAVRASRQGKDIDYGSRTYYVKTKNGPKGIMHGSGRLWTFGTPSDPDVWASVKYEEVTYDAGGRIVIDARGQLSNGKWWRYLGMFGESASYSDMDEVTASILDRFLDDACLKSSSR